MILWISSLSVVMSPFSFLILVIWVDSLLLLVRLAGGLPILLIFSKNQLLVLLILCIVFLFSISLISALTLVISCLLLALGFDCYCFSRSLRCVGRLFIWMSSVFLMWALSAINFPLNTVFKVSHRFWYVVSLLSFNSRNLFISPLISFLIYSSFRSVSFSLHVFM